MKRVAIDDPITLVFQAMTLCLTVEKVERQTFYCAAGDGLPDVGGVPLHHDDEGSLWIRGWYTPDSEEVKAARVAQEIGDDRKRPQRPTYRELEEQAKRNEVEADNARKLLDDMKRRAEQERHAHPEPRRGYPWRLEQPLHPRPNESHSDAAWRKLKGY